MKMRIAPLVALAALALAGCGSVHRPPPPDKNCVCQDDRPVSISIGGDGKPAPDRPILLVPRGSMKPIVWRLDPTSGLRFSREGIVIDGRLLDQLVYTDRQQRAVLLEPNPRAFAEGCRVSEDRLQVTCGYRSAGPAAYKYTIKVQRGANGDPIVVDPMVIEP